MTLTPQQVAEKKFTSTRFKNGYDETEVDAFLDEVQAELTRLSDESASLRRQLESAQLAQAVQPEPPAGAPAASGEITATQGEMEEMLRRTLLLAQRTADEVVAEAKADAEDQLSSARSQAESLRLESERRAAESERAAAIRASVAIAEFETAKRRLEAQIAALHTFEADFRGRLRAYLELQLNDLDEAALVPPGEPDAAGADASGAPRPEPAPVVLPDLPPLPSWMSAETGLATEDDADVTGGPPPEDA